MMLPAALQSSSRTRVTRCNETYVILVGSLVKRNAFPQFLVHRTAHDNKILPDQIPKGLRAEKHVLILPALWLHMGNSTSCKMVPSINTLPTFIAAFTLPAVLPEKSTQRLFLELVKSFQRQGCPEVNLTPLPF